MIIVGWIIVLILSYLIGSIPSGLIVGQAGWKTDLRKRGSGNIGATNAWRVLGPRAGMLVFAMDFLKGVIPVVIASHLVGTPWSLVMAGGMALIGHVASLFTQFKGGKAVATGLGVITAMVPQAAIITFLIWVLILIVTRYVSLASIVASLFVPLQMVVLHCPAEYFGFGIFCACLIILRHKDNIKRLLDGTENKIH